MGAIIAAAQEERFTRIKHDASFPFNAINYCLEEAKLDIGDLDAIAFYDNPGISLGSWNHWWLGFPKAGDNGTLSLLI